MKQLQMNKKEIGKEIEILIRSIKLHYDNIAEEVRIPSIELELITAKIRKLHDKSIIFNHLHYMEEQQSRLNRIELEMEAEDDETPEENFIINASEIPTPLVTPTITEKIQNIITTDTPENVIVKELTNEKVPEPIIIIEEIKKTEEINTKQPNTEEPAKPKLDEVVSNTIIGKDLKKIIGFSDKYFFISQLFDGNADDFNTELNTINLSTSSANAFEHIENIKKQKSWSDDSEALQSLKRYITNKFS